MRLKIDGYDLLPYIVFVHNTNGYNNKSIQSNR